jgi:hypothetical protein
MSEMEISPRMEARNNEREGVSRELGSVLHCRDCESHVRQEVGVVRMRCCLYLA